MDMREQAVMAVGSDRGHLAEQDKRGTTHVRRLLEQLKNHGCMDAHELSEATGIKLSIVIATLFAAGGRGQVSTRPAAEDPVYRARGRRGQIYQFVSFEATQRLRQNRRAQDAERMADLEQALMPGLRDTLRTLVAASSPFVVRRFDWARELAEFAADEDVAGEMSMAGARRESKSTVVSRAASVH